MDTLKIAITGHRPNKLYGYNLKDPLYEQLKNKIVSKLFNMKNKHNADKLVLISGMALGVDTLFAEFAKSKNLELYAILPCKNQDAKWSAFSKNKYKNLLNYAETNGKVECLNEKWHKGCELERNKRIAEECDILIAVWNGDKHSGTYNCMKHAYSLNKTVIIVQP